MRKLDALEAEVIAEDHLGALLEDEPGFREWRLFRDLCVAVAQYDTPDQAQKVRLILLQAFIEYLCMGQQECGFRQWRPFADLSVAVARHGAPGPAGAPLLRL